jgi:hypothetical protein
MVAVAGVHEYDEARTVGVFVTDRARRRLLVHSQHPVNAIELLLLHLETGTALSLIEHRLGAARSSDWSG